MHGLLEQRQLLRRVRAGNVGKEQQRQVEVDGELDLARHVQIELPEIELGEVRRGQHPRRKRPKGLVPVTVVIPAVEPPQLLVRELALADVAPGVLRRPLPHLDDQRAHDNQPGAPGRALARRHLAAGRRRIPIAQGHLRRA